MEISSQYCELVIYYYYYYYDGTNLVVLLCHHDVVDVLLFMCTCAGCSLSLSVSMAVISCSTCKDIDACPRSTHVFTVQKSPVH